LSGWNRVMGWLVAVLPLCAVTAAEWETARAALHDKLYPIAQAHAEKALAEGEAPEIALLILAEALAAQDLPQELLRRLDAHPEWIQRAPQPEAFAYWRAWALMRLGQPLEAARIAELAAAEPSSYADALRRLAARARLAAGDQAGALTLFATVDRTSTNRATRVENALDWALALEQAGRTEAALEVLKAQAEHAESGTAMSEGALLRGRLLFNLGQTSEATRIFNQLAMNERATGSARVQALVEMSVYTLQEGKTNEALAYARSAYDRARQPESRLLAGFRLGDLLSASPDTIDEAEKIIKALVREFPEHPCAMRAHLKLADALLQANRPERAADEYRIFLETYPPSSLHAEVLQGRGWALMRLGRYAEAGGMFQRASETATNLAEKAECIFKQGDALLADGRFAEASAAYAKMAGQFPQSPLAGRALYQSAECLERAGRRAEAGQQYRHVAQTFSDREEAPRALLRYAAMQAEDNALEEAVKTYTDVLEAYPQPAVRADALMGRGKALYRTYRFDAAMQDFASVAESTPARRDEARFLLTQCLYGLGRDREAHAAGTAFLLAFPESDFLPDMMLWLGKTTFNSGAYEEASRFFLDYVTRWPAGRWADAALLWAARAAAAKMDFTGAVELVTRLVRAYPQSARLTEALRVQGDALMELARFDEAILLFDQILLKAPAGDEAKQALLRKADCLFALGAGNSLRYQEALEAYQTLLAENDLAPALTLQLHFKAGRCLEKLKRVDEAIDRYYADVMLRYQDARSRGVWFDATGDSLFVRAAFNVADLYEQKGQPEQAVPVLRRVRDSGMPGSEEAQRRIERLHQTKMGGI